MSGAELPGSPGCEHPSASLVDPRTPHFPPPLRAANLFHSMDDRSHLLTEQRLPDSMSLDAMPIADAVALMNEQDRRAVEAVAKEQQSIARAVELVVGSFRHGGRLLYVGAGTSGRLGVLDASECPPTFRTDPEMVQ